MTRHHTSHFTYTEATAWLKKNHTLLEELVDLVAGLRNAGYDIYSHSYFSGMGPNGKKETPADMECLIEILKYFDKSGVLVKGLEKGLIDFPYIRENGEEVYLCYLLGEGTILYWHSKDGGFAARKPVSTL